MPRRTTNGTLAPPDPWLYFEDVAAHLEIEVRTLRHLRATGQGPAFIKVGRRLRIRKSKANQWFADKYETPQ